MLIKKFQNILQIFSFSILFFSACTTTKSMDSENFDYYGNNLNRNIGNAQDPASIAYFEQNIGNKIYFETNGHELTEMGFETANHQIHWLSSKPHYKIVIEGHCDERGTREHNIALGERRAFEVKKYFTQNGIQSDKISVISYGKEKQEVFGLNEEAWKLNRRAVIFLE